MEAEELRDTRGQVTIQEAILSQTSAGLTGAAVLLGSSVGDVINRAAMCVEGASSCTGS